jgi:hypothetical protein
MIYLRLFPIYRHRHKPIVKGANYVTVTLVTCPSNSLSQNDKHFTRILLPTRTALSVNWLVRLWRPGFDSRRLQGFFSLPQILDGCVTRLPIRRPWSLVTTNSSGQKSGRISELKSSRNLCSSNTALIQGVPCSSTGKFAYMFCRMNTLLSFS